MRDSSIPSKEYHSSDKLELDVKFEAGPRGLHYSYSEAEILYDALQIHRDNLVKEIEDTCKLYSSQIQLTQPELQAAFSSGDFVILLDQIKVLNKQIDNIALNALAILRQQSQPD